MASPLHPETDPARLDAFTVDAAERIRLLAALAAAGETVTLYPRGADDCAVASQVLAFDPGGRGIELAFSADPTREAAFRRGGAATAVALLARVKLQFELERLALDHPPSRLRAPLPERVVRLQRRDAYRVTPPTAGQARLWISDPGSIAGERRVLLLDLSASGIAFEFDVPPAATPVGGSVLAGCRLMLPATAPIRCDLLVRTVAPQPDPPGAGSHRVGCEFVSLEPSAARAVQRYVNAAQTLGRRLRPKLA